jgi:hypothetical protein
VNTALHLEALRSPTDTPPPVRRLPALGYFERPAPVRLILGSFLFLTLPVAALVLLLPDAAAFTWLYIWLFGGTHIVLTLTIYGSRANRRYFTSTPRKIAVFIAIPLALLGCYLAIRTLDLAATVPWFAVGFWAGLRFFNFFHLTRQTFGVHQMFKARTKTKFPAWAKRCENGTGAALVATLMLTHAAGGICPLFTEAAAELRVAWLSCAALAVLLYSASMIALFRIPASPTAHSAMLYFTLQTLGAAAATLYLPLYLAALAMHYVEYHVLMVPRIAKQELDPASRIDRGYGWLRTRPVAFLVAVFALSALVTTGMSAMELDASGNAGWATLLTAFDALVAVHYFLEMQIWKFSDPHIRKSLDGVYFAKRVPASRTDR